MEHTPTPWEVDNHGIIFHGKTQIGTVATQPMYKEAPEGTTEANARFIVKACNNFEAMRDTLKACYRDVINHQHTGNTKEFPNRYDAVKNLELVLSQIEDGE